MKYLSSVLRKSMTSGAFICAFVWLAASCTQQKIPTPESEFGFEVGADHELFDYEESVGYFRKLEEASNRIQMKQAGFTSFERPWYIAVISTPENLKNLEKWRQVNQQLAHPGNLSEEEAAKLIKDAPVFVDINGGLHASEIAGSQHLPEFAYELMSMDEAEFKGYFDKMILILWPSLNPDGQNIVVDWYKEIKDTDFPNAPLKELYQKYVGHDNNRDGYMQNMQESRVLARTWRFWEPEILHVHHQMGGGGFGGGGDYHRIWLPPFAEPVGVNTPPRLLRQMNTLGMQMAMELETRGLAGANHLGSGFDAYYTGYNDYIGMYHNMVAYWTEVVSSGYANPQYTDPEVVKKNLKSFRPRSLYVSPWRGGWWRLRDQVDYMIGINYGVLKFAAANREDILYNRYMAGKETIEQFSNEAPYAYVVPREQNDRNAAVELLRRLAFNGIRISQLTQTADIDGVSYPEGTWVIPMNQEFAGLVKELLDVHPYPEIEEYPGGPLEQPYDAAGWTLSYSMGLDIAAVQHPLSEQTLGAMQPVTGTPDEWEGAKKVSLTTNAVAAGIKTPEARLSGSGSALALNPAENNAYIFLNRALAEGGQAVYTETAFDGKRGGHYVISGVDKSTMENWAAGLGLTAQWTDNTNGSNISKPRIGIYAPWNASMDEGWTRWLLDEHEFDYDRLRNDDIKAGNLRDKYDVILFASMFPNSIVTGISADRMPAPYAGGIGAEGVGALRSFINGGGNLVCMNQSCLFAIQQFNLPVQNVVQGLNRHEFYVSSSLLQTNINHSSRITSGMPEQAGIMFSNSPVFKTLGGFNGKILASYSGSDELLLSGYLNGDKYLRGNAAALDVNVGRGHVIMFGFSPQWRGQTFGTFKLLFNSLYSS